MMVCHPYNTSTLKHSFYFHLWTLSHKRYLYSLFIVCMAWPTNKHFKSDYTEQKGILNL